MKLSIITINYNNLEGLRKTIDSVVSQTWRDFEWIVVDGGSTDGSRELIEEYAAKGCFAWWCSEPDKGVYNAMNKGIKHAQGEYLNFMNSGDCFHESTTLEQVFVGKEYGADVLYGDTSMVTSGGCKILSEKDKLTLSFFRWSTICHQSVFIRLEVARKNEFDERYTIAADRKVWIQCMLNNQSFEHLGLIVSNYDTTGISSVNLTRSKQEHRAIWDELIPYSVSKDYEELDSYKKIFINNPELLELYRLMHLRRLYKRMIHFCVRLIHVVEKI